MMMLSGLYLIILDRSHWLLAEKITLIKGESEYEDEEPIETSHTSITTNEVF
jgi:hypothetical protein